MERTNVTHKQTVLKSIVGGSLLAAVAMAQSPTYKVIDLGTVGPNGQPFVITNDGLVAGAVQNGNTLQAVLWYKGKMIDLGKHGLQGPNSQAFGVNGFGEAVGEAQTTTPDPNGEDFCGFKALGLSSSGTTKCLETAEVLAIRVRSGGTWSFVFRHDLCSVPVAKRRHECASHARRQQRLGQPDQRLGRSGRSRGERRAGRDMPIRQSTKTAVQARGLAKRIPPGTSHASRRPGWKC